jgi:cyclase
MTLRYVFLGAALTLFAAIGWAGYQFHLRQRTDTVKLDDGLYVVLGGGGNSAVLIGDDGVLVVDPKSLAPGRRLARFIRSLTSKPVAVIIDTDYHADHTHGNVNYPAPVDVVAQRRTRAHCIALDKDYWEVEPAWSHLPADLVDGEKDLRFGDEFVRVIHPGRGHTDGDVVVDFSRHHLLLTGDLFVRGLYPYVDRRAGGSVRRWPATLDAVLAVGGVTRYVPGNGPVSARADVVRFQRYLRTLVAQVQAQVAIGRSLAQTEAAVDLRGYDDWRDVPFLTSRVKNIASAYAELTGTR